MPAKSNSIALFLTVMLVGCAAPPATQAPADHSADTTHDEGETIPVERSTAAVQPDDISLDPSAGSEIGAMYEAYLSPHQEPGEEKDTPDAIPEQFQSTEPSLLRSERPDRGHGMIRFTKDLSRVFVDVAVENVNADDVVMFHIHCGRPDMLGPILIDFALTTDLQDNLADGLFSVEITNDDILATLESSHGLIGEFTVGCPIVPGLPDKVKTIAGMEYIAQQGELYFNLHTVGQTFYGDIRGQLHEVEANP